ncbi:ATP-binding protein [Streptomyces antibioticus]|nr:ATP-binding protein [Streptomyces antibioticus]
MEVRRAERLAREVDAFSHWFASPNQTDGGRSVTVTLFDESPRTAQIARDMTDVFLTDAGAGELVDDARLVVSELVGNVVNHVVPERDLARPGGVRRIDMTFKVWPKWVFIGVADQDSSPPLLPLGDAFSPGLTGELSEAVLQDSGRGLFIVQHLASSVWWRPGSQGGKTIWCRFDRDDGAAERKPC